MKILSKGLVIVASFFGIWFLLSKLDYIAFFKIEIKKSDIEINLGNIIWEQIENSEKVIYEDSILSTLDSLIMPLCKTNNIDRDSLKVHVISNSQVNAFALPNNHLVIYTGLINKSKNEQMLLGVIGHEIAHIQNNHVMKKLSKEIGLSAIFAITAGSNSRIISKILKTITSTSYDRDLEREADLQSVKYMLKASIDPRPFADFLYDLSIDNEFEKYTEAISTHPDSESRAKDILKFIKGKKIKSKQIITNQEWEEFKVRVKAF